MDFSYDNTDALYNTEMNVIAGASTKGDSSRDDQFSGTSYHYINEARNILEEILKITSKSNIPSITTVSAEPNVKEAIMQITSELKEKYPLITVDDEVLGEPRLTGTRFAVSNVLTALTLHNSFDEVIDEYDNRYTETQLKDAVRFARDFLDSFYAS